MTNRGLEKNIQFVETEVKRGEQETKVEDDIIIVTALVTFSRGDSVKGRFEFHFMTQTDSNDNYLGKENNDGIRCNILYKNNNKKNLNTKKIKMLKIQFI